MKAKGSEWDHIYFVEFSMGLCINNMKAKIILFLQDYGVDSTIKIAPFIFHIYFVSHGGGGIVSEEVSMSEVGMRGRRHAAAHCTGSGLALKVSRHIHFHCCSPLLSLLGHAGGSTCIAFQLWLSHPPMVLWLICLISSNSLCLMLKP